MMDSTLDQIIDVLDMKQLNVMRVNELLEDCLTAIADRDSKNISLLISKQNVIENRIRIIDETLQRGQIALLGFERLRPHIETFYATH